MKNKALRRSQTLKKAVKRYKLYHSDKARDHDNLVAFGIEPFGKSPHIYHKRKGCDCRGCTARKKTAKIRAHNAARTEARNITKNERE